MTLGTETKLLKRMSLGNLRELRVIEGLIDFSSNDYLGLARSAQLSSVISQEGKMHGDRLNQHGSSGSRLLTGNTTYAQDLEQKIALFHRYEAGLLFNCGYMANVGLLSTVANSKDTIIFDANVHASTRDGIRLSRAKAFPFKHNDLDHLEHRLKNCPSSGNRLICIESIYSTDGSQAPLRAIVKLAEQYDALLIIDEAHAVGVFGPHGKGLVAEYDLTDHVFAQVTTFGKAPGVHGAIVLGSQSLKQALINFATSFIYTTALPFHTLAAIKCSYALFPTLEKERRHLKRLIQVFQEIYPHAPDSPIQSILTPGNLATKKIAKQLAEAGLDVRPLLSPTVVRGNEMLRVCLHVFNTESELRSLLKMVRYYA